MVDPDVRERLDHAAARLGRESHRGLGRDLGVHWVRVAQAQEPHASRRTTMEVADLMTWRLPFFDLASGLFVPKLVTWNPEPGAGRALPSP